MSLRIKHDGRAMWRGVHIGEVKWAQGSYQFTSNGHYAWAPAALIERYRLDLANKLTRALVKYEQDQRRAVKQAWSGS